MSPHLGQHTGKAWISCSKPSTGHETARDYSAFPGGRDCGSRACLPWRKGGVGGHPTAAPPVPTVVLEKMDQALRTVQGGRRSWKHTAFTSLFPSQWGTLKTRDEAEQAAGGRGRWEEMKGLWILNTAQHSKSAAELRSPPTHLRLKGFSRPTTISWQLPAEQQDGGKRKLPSVSANCVRRNTCAVFYLWQFCIIKRRY